MLPNVVTSHSTHAGGSGGTSETPSQLSRISGKTRLRVNGGAAACTPGRTPGRCERSECVLLPAPVLSGGRRCWAVFCLPRTLAKNVPELPILTTSQLDYCFARPENVPQVPVIQARFLPKPAEVPVPARGGTVRNSVSLLFRLSSGLYQPRKDNVDTFRPQDNQYLPRADIQLFCLPSLLYECHISLKSPPSAP